jgi:bacterioferritin-associated ferredoxin
VQCRLPVGGCCGTCQDTARQVVDEHLNASAAASWNACAAPS